MCKRKDYQNLTKHKEIQLKEFRRIETGIKVVISTTKITSKFTDNIKSENKVMTRTNDGTINEQTNVKTKRNTGVYKKLGNLLNFLTSVKYLSRFINHCLH